MRAAFATLALAGLAAANPAPQAVTSAIAPSQSPPAGCYENYDGTFLIGPVNTSSSSKRDLEAAFEIIPLDKRNTQLGITLKNGILTDPQGRTGYVAANQQFQFDGPPQAGAIWTAGFSVCDNNRLALGNDQTWWKCLSGSFYNLYYKSIGGQCIESYLITRPVGGQGGPISSGNAGSQQSTATTPAEPSTVASASASGMNSTANATASASSSMSMSGSASMMTTVVNGHTTVVPVTAGMTGTNTNTAMTGTGASTTPTPNGSPTGAAASSSSSPGAAPMATLKSEMMGLAAGLLALAAL